MKILLLGLIALSSISAFSAESFKVMPKGAIRQGTLALGSYIFTKIEYREEDGFKPREGKNVILEVSEIKQKAYSKYTAYVGQAGSENMGYATDVLTTIQVKVIDGKKTIACSMSSVGLDDGLSDAIGFDNAQLGCRGENSKESYDIKLNDYSENRVDQSTASVELIVSIRRDGWLGSKNRTVTSEIKAK